MDTIKFKWRDVVYTEQFCDKRDRQTVRIKTSPIDLVYMNILIQY